MCHATLHRALSAAAVALVILTAAGCKGRPAALRPTAGGRPYEVLVVGDRNGIVARTLQQEATGLPQSEPDYDVSAIDSGRLNATLQGAHSIVTVDINPTTYTTTSLRVRRDVYADQQSVIGITSPSLHRLTADTSRWVPRLRAALRRHELRRALGRLSHERNAKAEKEIRQMFGLRMWIPQDMTATRRGKDFIWLSNNSATAMQNIVVYRAPGPHSPQHFIALRDSALGLNIKGETDRMQMQTVPAGLHMSGWKSPRGAAIVCRGLWQMQGDDMGGPFVSHSVGGITAEAFVYAPGVKKRNKIRQTEAVLYTIK